MQVGHYLSISALISAPPSTDRSSQTGGMLLDQSSLKPTTRLPVVACKVRVLSSELGVNAVSGDGGLDCQSRDA